MSLTIGKAVPDFILNNQDGVAVQLSSLRGKKGLLYFYPKDMTSGCTLEAQGFRDMEKQFAQLNTVILGISVDSEVSHKKFCEKESLNFMLLADIDKKVVNEYGVWVEKSMYGRKYFGIQRDSFLIDEKGKLMQHFEKVKPVVHPAEVIEFIKQ